MRPAFLTFLHRWGWVLAIIACYLVFLDRGLNEPDEGRYAELGREMAAPGGDWLVPHLNGFPHFQKPPLLYYCTAISLKIFGASAWAARLPSALAALGTLALTAWIARMLFGNGYQRITVLLLASCAGFYWLARLLTPDMMLTFFATAAIACSVRRHFGGEKYWGYLFFVAMGLGFMTKGPMALVVPLSATLFMRARLPREGRPTLPWVTGLLVTLALGLWWFIALSIQHRELFRYFAGYELVSRFASGAHGRSKPWWFFFVVVPIAFLPWTAWLPSAVRTLWRQRRDVAFGPRAGLLLGWIAVPGLVLTFSGSKLPTYILPLLPAFALLLIAWWREHPERPVLLMRFAAGMLAFLVATGAMSDLADPWLKQQANTRHLAELARAQPDFAQASIFAARVRAQGFTFAIGHPINVTDDEADIVLPPTPEQQARLFKDSEALEQEMARRPVAYGIVRRGDFGKNFPASRWRALNTEGEFVLLGRGQGN